MGTGIDTERECVRERERESNNRFGVSHEY